MSKTEDSSDNSFWDPDSMNDLDWRSSDGFLFLRLWPPIAKHPKKDRLRVDKAYLEIKSFVRWRLLFCQGDFC